MSSETPMTDQGRWLIDHQGLVNIGKIDGSMRGDEIDLRASVVTIETEAWNAALTAVEEAVGGLDRDRGDETWDTIVRQDVLGRIAALRKGA